MIFYLPVVADTVRCGDNPFPGDDYHRNPPPHHHHHLLAPPGALKTGPCRYLILPLIALSVKYHSIMI